MSRLGNRWEELLPKALEVSELLFKKGRVLSSITQCVLSKALLSLQSVLKSQMDSLE